MGAWFVGEEIKRRMDSCFPLSRFLARDSRKRLEKRKVDRVFANHSLSSTASQGTSNIPGFYSHLETARHGWKKEEREVPGWVRVDDGSLEESRPMLEKRSVWGAALIFGTIDR